jgi:uncharacterized protein YndB with AHSA1/START domain
MRFANTITIDRPPAAVFAYLADLENLPRWNCAISETRKITAGPVRVGSRYRQSRTIPVHSEESLEVVEFEPDRRFVIRGTLSSLPGQIGYTPSRTENATTLTNTVELQPPHTLVWWHSGGAPDQVRGSRQPRRTQANPRTGMTSAAVRTGHAPTARSHP